MNLFFAAIGAFVLDTRKLCFSLGLTSSSASSISLSGLRMVSVVVPT